MDALDRIATALEGILALLMDLPNPNPNPKPNPKPKSKPKSKKTYHPAFEAWWKAYPRQVAKEAAYKAWVAAGKRIRAEKGMSAAEASEFMVAKAREFAQTPKGRHPIYCPYPSTFLNQGRYDDDPACWQHAGEDTRPAAHEGPAEGLAEYAT